MPTAVATSDAAAIRSLAPAPRVPWVAIVPVRRTGHPAALASVWSKAARSPCCLRLMAMLSLARLTGWAYAALPLTMATFWARDQGAAASRAVAVRASRERFMERLEVEKGLEEVGARKCRKAGADAVSACQQGTVSAGFRWPVHAGRHR